MRGKIKVRQKSRTEYSARNTMTAMISRSLAILMGYVTRVVFTRMLSQNFVGVNGLFSDIINVLSLSELGIETAITYALYQPIAQNDIEKEKSIMQLYRRFYRIVAAAVTVSGLAVVPFLGVLIKNPPQVDHLTLIYLLYLGNTAMSYFMIYKKTLIDAHQLSYVGTLYQTASWILQDVIQILILIFTKNFILFLLVNIFCTFGCNLCISRRADRMYPFLKEKNVQKLDEAEKRGIFKNIRAMMMHKVGDVVVNNTDNILLSSFVGIASAGCYSNYFLLIASVQQVMDQAFQGIAASVGNLGATQGRNSIQRVFDSTFFLVQWLYGFAAVCLYELLNPFVELSFGVRYLFSGSVVLMLCINFFINGMRRATLVFRDSLGLFWFDRYKSVAEALINLAASILLVMRFGTIGVFLGTFISTAATSAWVEPYVLYKYQLKTSCRPYFAHYAVYTAVVGTAWFVTDKICGLVSGSALQLVILRAFICLIVPNSIFLAAYARTKEFSFVFQKISGLLQEKISRGKRHGK